MNFFLFLATFLIFTSIQAFAKDDKSSDRNKVQIQKLQPINFPNAIWWCKWEELLKKYEAGLKGVPGPVGPQGPIGAGGPVGPQGHKGDKGDQGITGSQGPAGPTGANGEKGEQVPVGLPGPKGDKGDEGIAGPLGPVGLLGPRGDVGPTGPQGLEGPKGDSADPAQLNALRDQIFDLKLQNSILMQVVNSLRPCSGSVSFSAAATNRCTVIEGDLVFDANDDSVASQNAGVFYGDIRTITEVKGSIVIRDTAIVERIYYGFPSLTRVGGNVVYSNNQRLTAMISSNFIASIGEIQFLRVCPNLVQ